MIQSFSFEQEMGPLPLQLVDAFGLVIQCKDAVGKHALLAQTVHTLKKAVQPGKPLYSSCWEFSTQDYKEVQKHVVIQKYTTGFYPLMLYFKIFLAFQLIAYAQSLQMELSPEAEKLIHGYFMASRRVRTQPHGVKVSMASIELL